MLKRKLLVIDDDAALLYSVRKSLQRDDLDVVTAPSAAEGLVAFNKHGPRVVLLDLRLHEASGLDLLREIRALDPTVAVVMFTAFSTTSASIEASQIGAFEYLLKPVDLSQLKQTIDSAFASAAPAVPAGEPAVDAADPQDFAMTGSSQAMQSVYKQIGRFAASSTNVLILGESGTGKELAARAIHHHSPRRASHFVAINCAALSETLLESELFGHERGAFTGADRRRVGKFEFANGGTIFLDEVADMSAATQAKVLRLLQDQRFERLGGNESIVTDVRIVAATNKDIDAMVRAGTFREDLYYRLNVFSVRLPALRERLNDVPELVEHFVKLYKREFGKQTLVIDPEVLAVLGRYSWPGNMRELQSVIKYALAHAVSNRIGVEHLPAAVNGGAPVERAGAQARGVITSSALDAFAKNLILTGEPDLYAVAVKQLDRALLREVLDQTQGNLQRACEQLGMSRNTLKAKMREQGMAIERIVLSKDDSLDKF